MSRRRPPRQLSPLLIPFVAIVLTLLLAVIVFFYTVIHNDRVIPVPGPTVTVSVDANLNPIKTP